MSQENAVHKYEKNMPRKIVHDMLQNFEVFANHCLMDNGLNSLEKIGEIFFDQEVGPQGFSCISVNPRSDHWGGVAFLQVSLPLLPHV